MWGGRKRSGRVERLQLIECLLNVGDVPSDGRLERNQPSQHKRRRSSSLSLSLSKRSVEEGLVRSLIRGGVGWWVGA